MFRRTAVCCKPLDFSFLLNSYVLNDMKKSIFVVEIRNDEKKKLHTDIFVRHYDINIRLGMSDIFNGNMINC